jgi:pimeloyl-ACP methyl ester carboxylesterase
MALPKNTASVPTATAAQATATVPRPTVNALQTSTTLSPDTTDPASYTLSEPGPYYVGRRTYALEDSGRSNRPVGITVWYPALFTEGSSGTISVKDAIPDRSDEPYPMILSSTKIAKILAFQLVSHGFVWVSIDGIDTYRHMDEQMIDQPLDILFALDQIAANPPDGLDGMIDTEHAGTIGYSFDGYNSLALSGARIDPEHYLAQCPNPEPTTEAILPRSLSAFDCGPATAWDEFAAHAGEAITASEDGLWQPMTDERIRAVMPLAGEGWWLFGERGLASVDKPTLIIVATRDELYSENVLIFEHLGVVDKTLVSFVGPGHMMVGDPEMVDRMAHFAVAFFGYYLQGRDDWAEYFSEDFVSQHDDLAWGVYEGE